MNTTSSLRFVAISGASLALAFTATAQATPNAEASRAAAVGAEKSVAPAVGKPAAPLESEAKPPSSSDPATVAATTPALTRGEAQETIVFAKRYVAHPPKVGPDGQEGPRVTMPEFDIAIPPPEPRTESKPAAPGPGVVWVPGHYMPVKGEWRWVRGEWAVPATPISVWIPARWDEKKQQWAPGYWQPDAPTPYGGEEVSPTKSGMPAAPAATSTPASTPSRY
jgi:hypothetical protein